MCWVGVDCSLLWTPHGLFTSAGPTDKHRQSLLRHLREKNVKLSIKQLENMYEKLSHLISP